jgi:hypothetical protein
MALKLTTIPTTQSARLASIRAENAKTMLCMGGNLRFNKAMMKNFNIQGDVYIGFHFEESENVDFQQDRPFYVTIHAKKLPETVKLQDAIGNNKGTKIAKIPLLAKKMGMDCTESQIIKYEVEPVKVNSKQRAIKLNMRSIETKRKMAFPGLIPQTQES